MNTINKTDTAKAKAMKIINTYAGSPTEITRQLKALNMRYVKVRKGGLV